MKQFECVHCGDTITVADKDEQIVDGETPLEHIERTGHPHVYEPRPTGCQYCGYLWMYSGTVTEESNQRITCPNCKSKVLPGVVAPEPE